MVGLGRLGDPLPPAEVPPVLPPPVTGVAPVPTTPTGIAPLLGLEVCWLEELEVAVAGRLGDGTEVRFLRCRRSASRRGEESWVSSSPAVCDSPTNPGGKPFADVSEAARGASGMPAVEP